jgi:hypothetical protein
MAYAVNLTGADLANHLAVELTDLEFELLVRKRIETAFATVHKSRPNLSDSHNKCYFFYRLQVKCCRTHFATLLISWTLKNATSCLCYLHRLLLPLIWKTTTLPSSCMETAWN